MCMFITPAVVKKTAKKNMVVYKDGHMRDGVFISLRQDHPYNKKELQPSIKIAPCYRRAGDSPATSADSSNLWKYFPEEGTATKGIRVIRKGYHFHEKIHDVYSWITLAEFIIPKGTIYWINPETNLGVAETLYLNKIL